MKLHYAPGTISIAVAIALHEGGLKFDAIPVDFKFKAQTQPAYRQINPKGRVPALETDDGILTETGAILDYIAAIAPDARLMPEGPFQAAQLRGVMYYLASTMHVNHAHRLRGSRWADTATAQEDMRAKVPETMAESCIYIEQHCLAGPFVTGDRITVADAYLFVVCSWLEGDGIDVVAYPRIAAFRDAMEARPSVQAVRAAGMLR
ncbi:glutathione S-transferase family protein [Roseovarius sp. M141]|uniref:glutathione S-transferase family protein n=1 Tax=Roseovarius sp. M141 TaxID=2583806 RepID=UPI0020CE900C|nr:glutathione S-transferase family protein [Roseovarius sp. M141]MCQ0091439.1 glutathione S-transferase family protein [Roseovarius sp. M141]